MRVSPASRPPRTALVLVSALVLLMVAPVAAGQVYFDEVTVHLGPQQIEAELSGHTFEGQEADDLRQWIDREHGNGDGEVTQDEVDAAVQRERNEFNERLRFGGAFFFEPFQINGRASMSQEVTDIRFSQSVLGEVDSGATVTREVDAVLTFASTERTRVEFSFAEDFAEPFSHQQVDMEWGVATFAPVSPWQIDGATINPGGSENPYFDGEVFRVPYEESENFSSEEDPLTFDLVDTTEEELTDESEDSPAPAIGFLLAMVGLIAFIQRAGRRKA